MISCNFGCFLRCVCLSREAEKQRIGRGMGLAGQKVEIGIGGRGRVCWNKTTNRMENRKSGKEENGMLDQ